ncbi:MAG TPA: hypothetical protein ENK10_05585, partial [Acidobacteria bacterium]|nr:hypothetical protein [Acidobacteriota bacterium]
MTTGTSKSGAARRVALLAAGLALALSCGKPDNPKSEQPPIPPLRHFVGAALLRQHLERGEALLLVDIRREADYAAGHLPQAVSVPLETLRPDPLGRLPAARRREIGEALRRAGVRPDLPVVVAGEPGRGGFLDAALACWVMALGGTTDCHLLEGGTPSWVAAGGKLVTERFAPLRVEGATAEIPLDPPALADLQRLRQATVSVDTALVDVREQAPDRVP